MNDNPYATKPWLKHYDKGVRAEIDFPEMNLSEFLDKAFQHPSPLCFSTFPLLSREQNSGYTDE